METNKKHIDLAYLKQIANGSNEFIAQMISLFLVQTPEAFKLMNNHLKTKNWSALRAIAHKMKPSFAFMGIKEVEADIRLVETYSESETNLDQIPALLERITRICTMAISELEVEKKALQ